MRPKSLGLVVLVTVDQPGVKLLNSTLVYFSYFVWGGWAGRGVEKKDVEIFR